MKKTLILLFILSNFLFASIGQITAIVGDVKISRDSKTILAKLGEELEKNDVINSAKGSKAQVTMNDNTIITIGQNSTLNIFDYVYDASKPKDSKASFGFMKGSFKSITGRIGKINKSRFKLKTKSASIGIRGTTIIGNQQIIACTDGAITVTAAGVSVDVAKQEFTTTPKGKPPTPPQPLKQNTLDSLESQDDGGDTDSQSSETKVSTPNKNDDDKHDNIKKILDDNRIYTGNQLTGTSTSNVNPNYISTKINGIYINNQVKLTGLKNIFNPNKKIDVTFNNIYFDNPMNTSYHSYGLKSQNLKIDNTIYNLIADNTGEFLMAYYTNEATNSSGLLFTGTKVDMSAFDLSKIYIYDDYKSIDLNFNPENSLTLTQLNNNSKNIYLNYQTKSMTYFGAKNYEDGASYDAGYLNNDGTFSFNNLSQKEISDTTYKEVGNATGSIYGSNAQGIAYHGESNISDLSNTTQSTSKNSGAGYLKSTFSNTNTEPETIQLTGLTTNIENSDNGTNVTNGTINLSVNQENGNINGNIESLLTLNGTTSNLSSYYISDDLFGVEQSSTSYLNALPDRVKNVDGEDVYYMVDDKSSWGYWVSAENNIIRYSTWVAGAEINASNYYESPNKKQATYKGHILGAVINGTDIDPIKFDSSNYANFVIMFGGGINNFSGNMGFTTKTGNTWAATIDETHMLSPSSFSSTNISGTVTTPEQVTTAINTGKVDVRHVGTATKLSGIHGTVSLTSGSNVASGVFKSTLENIVNK